MLKPFVRTAGCARSRSPATRAKSMPDVPTMAEAGVPGYELTAWAGIAAPAGTPRAIIDRLYGEMAKILATAEAMQWFESFGVEPGGETPEAFAALVRAENARSARSFAPWASRRNSAAD